MKYPVIASIISLAFASTAGAQLLNGGLTANPIQQNASYSSTALTLNVANLIFQATGDFATSVPVFPTDSELTASGATISGLSTTPTTENVPDYFVFSSASTPANRFDFTLTSLTDNGSGSFNGSGTLIDTTGAFANTPASFTVGFSSASNYSFSFDTIVPTPEPSTISLIAIGSLGAWALRRRKA